MHACTHTHEKTFYCEAQATNGASTGRHRTSIAPGRCAQTSGMHAHAFTFHGACILAHAYAVRGPHKTRAVCRAPPRVARRRRRRACVEHAHRTWGIEWQRGRAAPPQNPVTVTICRCAQDPRFREARRAREPRTRAAFGERRKRARRRQCLRRKVRRAVGRPHHDPP